MLDMASDFANVRKDARDCPAAAASKMEQGSKSIPFDFHE
jgi:hypothetical protein